MDYNLNKDNQMTNDEKLELIYNDLAQWMDGNDFDGGLEYSFRNGYYLHPINLWLSSGAMSEEVENKLNACNEVIFINRTKELAEIKEICENASIYICPDCNHHAFLDDNEGDEIDCQSCLSIAKLEKAV